MFEAIRAELQAVQEIHDRLPDAAIAVATEVRNKVKKRQRAGARRRLEQRLELRASGFTASEARVAVNRGRRKTSGISIDGTATADGVRLTASDQVQHFRRELGETADLVDVFRRNVHVAEEFRRRRGGG